MRGCCHSSAVKDYSLFRFYVLTSTQIMESVMTEQLIKLDLHCNEQYFFLKTRRKEMSGSFPSCLEWKASNLFVITSQRSKPGLPNPWPARLFMWPAIARADRPQERQSCNTSNHLAFNMNITFKNANF